MSDSSRDRNKKGSELFWRSLAPLLILAVSGAATLLVSSCLEAPKLNDPDSKIALMYEVRKALSSEDCTRAIAMIEPLYNSGLTDNEVRLLRASAHGCQAGINFFEFTEFIMSADLTVPGFWTSMTEFFYKSDSRALDLGIDSVGYGTDGLFSVLHTGIVVPPAYRVNDGTYNMGSLRVEDRTDDSNLYLVYMAMAGIGDIQSRYGNPTPTYGQGANLPWQQGIQFVDGDLNDEVGCTYAASILNMIDAIDQTAPLFPEGLSSSLMTISTTLGGAMDAACANGCAGNDWDGTAGFDDNGAGGICGDGTNPAVVCTACPESLRDRTTCLSDTTNVHKCAAAGIVRFVNASPQGWQ